MVPVDYPDEHFSKIQPNTDLKTRPVIGEWMNHRKPLLLDMDQHCGLMSDFEKKEIVEFDLGWIGVHGQIDVSGRMASYFSFSKIPSLDPSFAKLMAAVVPHLHTALMNLAKNVRRDTRQPCLTDAEVQVLKYIIQGKANKEIAKILDKSERTVKNQVHSLLGKVGAKNRTEVIAMADFQGLLSPSL